ncbi:enoyl-CoA hydratase/carnithine racemase [Rhizobium tibeticum]|uniref:enoyl-CoA hydratase/isomerase family protein n=1 Tax=Rhizobium tibeticum TaxID=501024 RepID=UPI0027858323|nr:enoyl-CoA hydratase/isomerase family protein [Rhizobium tibeticum]MDP9811513.1 enoyl-CoA hydratase/carnithine racemase [Rhizobium tibeticum]
MKIGPGALGVVAASSTFLSAAALLMLPALALSGQTAVADNADRPAETKSQPGSEHAQIRVQKRTPAYWRVTFDNPPFNIFGPETIPQMEKVVADIETDPNVKVVVFDSAVPGFFLTHYNFTPPLSDSTNLPSGRTGLHPLPDMLVRISKAPVVSIALIRGRATGVGSELALASDMRFASREKAILSQWEVGAGFVPGGGPMARLPRLMGRGRALEVLLGSDDINGDLAEEYGYVNRSFPDAKLDAFVDALATRISGFDRQAIADTKRLVDFASLPSDPEIGAGWDAFITAVQRPVAQENIGKLMKMGLQTNADIEARLGHYTQTLAKN